MSLISTVLVIVLSVVLCFVEIPQMLKSKLYRELVAFSVILCCGVILTIVQGLNIPIPNPADFPATVFSPIVNLIKGALE